MNIHRAGKCARAPESRQFAVDEINDDLIRCPCSRCCAEREYKGTFRCPGCFSRRVSFLLRFAFLFCLLFCKILITQSIFYLLRRENFKSEGSGIMSFLARRGIFVSLTIWRTKRRGFSRWRRRFELVEQFPLSYKQSAMSAGLYRARCRVYDLVLPYSCRLFDLGALWSIVGIWNNDDGKLPWALKLEWWIIKSIIYRMKRYLFLQHNYVYGILSFCK